jgi:cyclase
MRTPLHTLALLAAITGALAAQPHTADPVKRGLALTDFPRLVKLADRVYGYEEIRQPGFTTVSLVVVGDRGVLIADGQGSAAATQTLLDRIRTLTALPVRWYVVGSDHGDHTAGNSVLPGGITYVVHATSRAQLVRDSASAAAAGARGGAPRVVVVPPVAMTGDEQAIDLGGISARVLFLGRAHTGGDLMVELPREKILFMSEAFLNRVFPAMRSAYPSDWVKTIDRALATKATRFVPGHGFIEEPARSREELVAFRTALVAVNAEVARLHALGLPADDAAKQARWGEYAEWFLAEQQAPIAVRRVYDEIEGKLAAVSAPPAASQQARPAGTLIASNMNDNTATLLDAASGRVLATHPTGEGPHEVTVSHSGAWALVSNYGVRGKPGNSITVIDVARLAVARTIVLEGFQRPHGMAFLPGDSQFVVTSETSQAVLVVDFAAGRVVRTLPTKGRGSHMIALTAKGDRLFTGNISDGTISAIDVSGRDSAVVMRVARQPEGIAVTPNGATVWVGSNRDSMVTVVDVRRATAMGAAGGAAAGAATSVAADTVRGFGLPYRMAITPDAQLAVVTDPARAEVRVFTVGDRKEKFRIAIPADSLVATAEVPGSPSPEGVALSRDGRWAFVTLQGRNRLITIDLTRGVIVAYAPTGVWSDGVGISPLVHAP